MHLSPSLMLLLLVILVILAVLITGSILQRRFTKRRRHRTTRPRRTSSMKKLWGFLFQRHDHGARIARKHGHERSSEWRKVAKEHLKHQPACAACGYRGKKRQVHHIKPFHLHPQLELDPDNLITLCSARGREHHLLLGHLDEWASYNEHIRTDVKRFYRKTSAQIRADLHWQKKIEQRP
jgi:5-methylcytosine-specific restriction endonuclease McrA